MKHNMLSAYQFVKDNLCALTLDTDGSTINDRSTGKMISQGQVKDGLFPLQSSSSPAATPFSAFIVSKLISDSGTIDWVILPLPFFEK